MARPDPVLRIDLSRVRTNVDRFFAATRQTFGEKTVRVFFAAKSHSSLVILKTLAKRGIGCEAHRAEELRWAKSLFMPVIVSGFVKPENVLCNAIGLVDYIVVET